MRIILAILFSVSAMAAQNYEGTERKAPDVAFMLEVDYPDKDTAHYIAYKSCGDKSPELKESLYEFDDHASYSLVASGSYEVVYYYDHGGKYPYYYKCPR